MFSRGARGVLRVVGSGARPDVALGRDCAVQNIYIQAHQIAPKLNTHIHLCSFSHLDEPRFCGNSSSFHFSQCSSNSLLPFSPQVQSALS